MFSDSNSMIDLSKIYPSYDSFFWNQKSGSHEFYSNSSLNREKSSSEETKFINEIRNENSIFRECSFSSINPPDISYESINLDEEIEDELDELDELKKIQSFLAPLKEGVSEELNAIPIMKEEFPNRSFSETRGIRIDDLNKEVFHSPMQFMKSFFKKRFDLNVEFFNCNDALGTSIRYMKTPLKFTIREILGHNKEISKRIEEKLESEKDGDKKMELNYFLDLNYEELFNKYIRGDINFQISKGTPSIIKEFITLEKAIQLKRERWRKLKKYKEDNSLLEFKLALFKRYSNTIIQDIKSGRKERGKNKIFKIRKGKKRMRNNP